MALDATFSVGGSSAVQAHEVAYGATVNLAVLSSAFHTIAWEISSSSKSGSTAPTITLAGTPTGSTASFPQVADPGDGLGRAWVVKCTVTDSQENQDVKYRVVGTLNVNGYMPVCADEFAYRDATHGWSQVINALLANAGLAAASAESFPITTIASENTTLDSTHYGKYLVFTHATPTLTVDDGYTAGKLILGHATQGVLTFIEGDGTIRKSALWGLTTSGAYAPFAIKVLAADEVHLSGELIDV